jgi:hypothetical protein
MKTLISLAIVSTLAACANTGVVQMSRDTFMVSKDSAKFGGGVSNAVRIEVYQDASSFCAKSGRYVETKDLQLTPGVPGRLGNVLLQFQCTASGDTGAVIGREIELVAVPMPFSSIPYTPVPIPQPPMAIKCTMQPVYGRPGSSTTTCR